MKRANVGGPVRHGKEKPAAGAPLALPAPEGFNGNPFALPDAFSLPGGSVVWVEGYADVDSGCPAAATLEVIPTLQLIFLPVAGSVDANGDLIPDDLEDLYAFSFQFPGACAAVF